MKKHKVIVEARKSKKAKQAGAVPAGAVPAGAVPMWDQYGDYRGKISPHVRAYKAVDLLMRLKDTATSGCSIISARLDYDDGFSVIVEGRVISKK